MFIVPNFFSSKQLLLIIMSTNAVQPKIETEKKPDAINPMFPSGTTLQQKKEEKKQTEVDINMPERKAAKLDLFFQCELCSAVFNRKFNRDRHMEIVHKTTSSDRLRPLYPARLERQNAMSDQVSSLPFTDYEATDKEPPETQPLTIDEPSMELGQTEEPKEELLQEISVEKVKTEKIDDSECPDTYSIAKLPLEKEIAVTIIVSSK